MKFPRFEFHTGILLIVLSITILIAGCNNPADSDEEEHPHPEGAVFMMNGEEIIHYENGEASGTIEVDEREETPLITIYFIDEEGNEFQPDDPENSLKWKDIDTSIAEIEQHDEDGKWSFHVLGIAQGSTTVTFQLDHNGHSDFDIQDVTINVN